MKWPAFQINPVTRKRLRRFRQMKRAWWSLWILVVLYAVSLVAELWCNDRPLFLRYEGETFFPVFFFYPEDRFTGNGKMSRPDYKNLRHSAAFRDEPGNFMIFPLIPFGPNEILDPSDINLPDVVDVTARPLAKAGNVRLLPGAELQRGLNTEFFFGKAGRELFQEKWEDYYALSPELKSAIEARFANEEAARFSTELAGKKDGLPGKVEVILPPYRPRSRPPRTVRVSLYEVLSGPGAEKQFRFSGAGKLLEGEENWLEGMAESDRKKLAAAIEKRRTSPIAEEEWDVAGQQYRFAFERESVRWPFRPVYWGHPLGVDEAGRDVLARIIYGFRISMSFGLLLVVISMSLGIVAGAVQGYFAGWVDITFQRLIEIWSALPFLYIMILMGSVYGRSFLLLLIIYALFNWIGISYYMRAEFLRLRRQQFVEAARGIGTPTWQILFKHIFPNALVPVITFFPFSLVGAIGALAALDYLGFGMPPPTASWGDLLNQAQNYRWAWWLILYPFLSLFSVMLLGVFVGEGIRSAWDPRDYTGI